MMFVHNAPSAINFAQTHRQPKFESFAFAILDVDAPSYRRSERNILAASDFHILKIKSNRVFPPTRKMSPTSPYTRPNPATRAGAVDRT
jgi:hypothetical protein